MVTENDLERKASELVLNVGPKGFGPVRRLAFKILIILIPLFAVSGIASGTYCCFCKPTGDITYPAESTPTDRVVEITGFFEHIPPENRYIWITVDVKRLGLCWPNHRIYKDNSRFKRIIPEEGPKGPFTVSLHAVDYGCNEEILKWQRGCREQNNYAGFTMLPERYKLDSVCWNLGLHNHSRIRKYHGKISKIARPKDFFLPSLYFYWG